MRIRYREGFCRADRKNGGRMKISITYTPEENREAAEILGAIKNMRPDAWVKQSDLDQLYNHFYITTKKPPRMGAKPCNITMA